MAPMLDPLRSFGVVDEAARAAMKNACTGVTFVPADTDLVRQGEASNCLRVLVSGWACHAKLLDDGRRQIPSLLLPGDVCDIDGLGGQALAYGVATLTQCQVATWPHHALAAVMMEHPSVGVVLLQMALAENTLLTQAAVVLARLSGLERVAHLLCELVARLEGLGRVEHDGCDLPLTQHELADVLGLSAVHVNRMLQELRGEGLIRLAERRLTVLDPEGLQALGQFQPDYLLLNDTKPRLTDEHRTVGGSS